MVYYYDDKVTYRGEKFAADLRGKVGQIIAKVGNSKDSYVVSFGGQDAFIMNEDNLVPANYRNDDVKPVLETSEEPKKSNDVEVVSVRKRKPSKKD